jgi:hypothetical protein
MTRSVRRWTYGSVSLLLVAGLATAVQASASGTPTVGVGGAAPSHASYTGSVAPGNPDPLGPPAPECSAGCQQQKVVLKAPSGYVTKHAITLAVALTYSGGGDGSLDVGILDSKGNLLASEFDVANHQAVAAPNVTPGTYTVEVDSDPGSAPSQGYTATLTAVGGPKFQPPRRTAGKLSFSRTTLVDPYRLGTEPTIAVAKDNKTLYESPIFGFSTTQTFLERSTNEGQTFNSLGVPGVGKVDNCTGGR